MHLAHDAKDIAFAEEVRAFVRENLCPLTRDQVLHGKLPRREQRLVWQRALVARGWGAPTWPVEYGGPGWTVVQRHLFDEVLTEEGAPAAPVFGMGMLAPVLMKFGSRSQKDRFLPRILNVEDWWCQGFSEPGAGSDLASLKTRAVRDGDEWVVNGQKIWTTLAHVADWMFCLVRTSDEPKKQLGLSLLLVPMSTPGVTVRPIITIDDEHEVNEVFLENVRIPAENVVGEPGKGWDYAKYLLSHERTGIARIGQSRREIRRLKALAADEPTPAGRLIDDRDFRTKVAEIEIRLTALELTTLRMLAAITGGAGPGAEANLLKIKGSEIQQDIAELMMDAVGRYALAYDAHAWSNGVHADPIGPADAAPLAGVYFNTRKVSIYGGSNEIQRNILAKSALGL
ncbi:MAG: acyl-CoA dehydrogenase family protein [Bordetella sp.]|nr:acyl-CoA dehydrogenase family protein [Bordetella sp.]